TVFQTPPEPTATYQTLGSPGSIATSAILPDMNAGPRLRSSSPFRVAAESRGESAPGLDRPVPRVGAPTSGVASRTSEQGIAARRSERMAISSRRSIGARLTSSGTGGPGRGALTQEP